MMTEIFKPREMNALESGVYNQGERLLPGVTHGMEELVRHASSYQFFRTLIEARMQHGRRATILDLGCGAGWGSAFLAEIPNVHVTGVDIGTAPLEYARTYHQHHNVEFRYADLRDFVHAMPEYDFIISRNMIEHVEGGIEIFKSLKWKEMLLIDVPYLEPEGVNLYHLIHNVDESHFSDFKHPFFVYQDMEGAIYASPPEGIVTNIMFIVCQHEPRLRKTDIALPIKAWQPKHEYSYYDQSQVPPKKWWQPYPRGRVHV